MLLTITSEVWSMTSTLSSKHFPAILLGTSFHWKALNSTFFEFGFIVSPILPTEIDPSRKVQSFCTLEVDIVGALIFDGSPKALRKRFPSRFDFSTIWFLGTRQLQEIFNVNSEL
ncbi:hypothetical protein Hanom_Chr01g00093191 [Helianthus anomalus]